MNGYAAFERKVDVMDGNEWIQFNKKWYDRQWHNSTGQSTNVSQEDRIALAERVMDKLILHAQNWDMKYLWSLPSLVGNDELEMIDWQDELFRTSPPMIYN